MVDPALSLSKTQESTQTQSEDLGYQKCAPLMSQVKLDKEQKERRKMCTHMKEDNTNAING